MDWKSRVVIWALIVAVAAAIVVPMLLFNGPKKLYLPNSGFEGVTYYGDKFSDAYGKRAFPWGFETWLGSPTFLFDDAVSRTGRYSAKITGHTVGDAGVVAIPGLSKKPPVSEGRQYVLTAWIKMFDVGGHGVRLAQQFFNDKGAIIKTVYSSFTQGTLNWRKITLTTMAPSGAVKGDPIIELWGVGTMWVDDVEFFEE